MALEAASLGQYWSPGMGGFKEWSLRSQGSENASGSSWTEATGLSSSPHPAWARVAGFLKTPEEGDLGVALFHSPRWGWAGSHATFTVRAEAEFVAFLALLLGPAAGQSGVWVFLGLGSAWILPGTGSSSPIRAGPAALGSPGGKKALPAHCSRESL